MLTYKSIAEPAKGQDQESCESQQPDIVRVRLLIECASGGEICKVNEENGTNAVITSPFQQDAQA